MPNPSNALLRSILAFMFLVVCLAVWRLWIAVGMTRQNSQAAQAVSAGPRRRYPWRDSVGEDQTEAVFAAASWED